MPDRKFCTNCGTQNEGSAQTCTRCGSRFATTDNLQVPGKQPRHPLQAGEPLKGGEPATLAAFIGTIISGMIKNFRKIIKGLITGMILSFVIVLVIHTLLLLAAGSPSGTGDLTSSVLTLAGLQSSPGTLLFWFLLTGIIAFFFSQARTRGIRKTAGKFLTLPAWIATAIRTSGIALLPLVTGGITVALVARLFLLTTLTTIELLVLMLGIIFVQQESLTVRALQFGYSDLSRAFRKIGPRVPAPGFAVMGITGVAAGFILALLVPDSLLVILAAAVLTVVGVVILRWKKRVPAAGMHAYLVLIRDNGGRR